MLGKTIVVKGKIDHISEQMINHTTSMSLEREQSMNHRYKIFMESSMLIF